MSLPEHLLNITASASEKIVEILSTKPEKPHFRLQIMGGGCSGFEYAFGVDDTIGEQDFHKNIQSQESHFMMLIDPISFQYVQNATIDYVSDTKGARFVVTNPNALTSCSCGSSFALKEPSGE